MKRALVVVAAFTLAALLAQHDRTHGGIAVAATPTPAAFAYDEITRMIVPPATPPAPGTFSADYQALTGSSTGSGDQSDSDQSQHQGLSNAINNVMGNPQQMMQRMSKGNVARYTYYKGWIRTDYPASQTAIIQKCQEHEYVTLDFTRKVATVQNTQPPCPTMQGMPGGGGGGESQSQPGTADITVSGSSKDLGALTIDGIETSGYDQSVQMATTNATGSCRDNNFSMNQTKYLSQVRVPRPFCPLPRTMGGGMMMRSSTGCQPRMHVSGQLAAINDLDHLVMYMRMAMGERASGMNMVIERGNVKWFGGPSADELFAIPPGFKQQ